MATTSRRAKRAKVSCCGRRCSSATVPCTYKASTDLKGQVPSDETHIVFAQAQTYSGIGQWQKASCCGPQVGKLILPQTLKYSQFTTYSLSYTFLYILIHSYIHSYTMYDRRILKQRQAKIVPGSSFKTYLSWILRILASPPQTKVLLQPGPDVEPRLWDWNGAEVVVNYSDSCNLLYDMNYNFVKWNEIKRNKTKRNEMNVACDEHHL